MESTINSNIRIKGGDIEGHPGIDANVLLGFGEEHAQHVRSLYRDLLHEDIHDFDLCIVLEAKSEESADSLQKIFEAVFAKWTTDDPDSSIRKIQRIIARSEDQEYRKYPKFFPKISKNGNHLIVKFVPITEFRQALHSAAERYAEELGAELKKKQEIKVELKLGKSYPELAKSENLIIDVFNSVLLKLFVHISKGITKKITSLFNKNDDELKMILSLHSILNNLNMDVDLSNSSTFSESIMETLIDQTSSQSRSLRRSLFELRPNSSVRNFLKDFNQHATENLKVFATSSHAAALVSVSLPGIVQQIITEDDD